MLGRAWKSLVSLYVEGAIEICTPGNAAGGELQCRTVLQPDGDVITWVSADIVSRKDFLDDVWPKHLDRIRAEVQMIGRFRAALKWSAAPPIALGAASGGLYSLIQGRMPDFSVAAAWVLLSLLIKGTVRLSLQHTIKRKLRNT